MTESAIQLGAGRPELWARQEGSGPDVVLISGLGDDLHVWDPVFAKFAESRRVTAFDNRGVGHSPIGHWEVSIAAFADDTAALMRALGIERADVVGSSMGGLISQELAMAEPDAVATLALVGTFGELDQHLERAVRHLRRLMELIEDPVELFDAISIWAYSGKAFEEGTVAELFEAALASEVPEQTFEDFSRSADAALAHDPGTRLAEIVAPTVVLTGSEDRLCPPRIGRRLAELIPGSDLQILEDRAHQPFQEVPDEFVALLNAFWAANGR